MIDKLDRLYDRCAARAARKLARLQRALDAAASRTPLRNPTRSLIDARGGNAVAAEHGEPEKQGCRDEQREEQLFAVADEQRDLHSGLGAQHRRA